MSNSAFLLDSYSTAVVLLPPADIQARINSLRNGNDKSFPRWTAHFTLLFPFVPPKQLLRAVDHLREVIQAARPAPFDIDLDHVGVSTVAHFLC